MSLRTSIVGIVEILLRVLPLFIIDEILKIGLGLSDQTETELQDNSENLDDNTFNYSAPVHYDSTFYGFIAISSAKLLLTTLGVASLCLFVLSRRHLALVSMQVISVGLLYISYYDSTFYEFIAISLARLLLSTLGVVAVCLFVLSTRHLALVYMHVISVGLVYISYWTNVSTIQAIAILGNADLSTSISDGLLSLNLNKLADPSGPASVALQNFFVQCVLTFIFLNIHLGPRYPILQKLLPISFLMPSILVLLPIPLVVLSYAPVFAALLPLAIVKFVLCASVVAVRQTIYNGCLYARKFVLSYGIDELVKAEWLRLRVSEVFRTFWGIRVLRHLQIFIISGRWYEIDEFTSVFRLIKSIMVSGCDTFTAVLGAAITVSYIFHHIGIFFQCVLLTKDKYRSIGAEAAKLFYILALLTDLTGLEAENRFVCLCRNFCLVFTVMLHFIHNIVEPLLMTLSASHNPSFESHLRALSVCGFLVLLPILLLHYLWSHHDASTWLVAVSALSIEVIVKVAASLAMYSLFWLDARRVTFWEELDDYLYYIKVFGTTEKFGFGIFLFFTEAWIFVFDSGGVTRALLVCFYAYFEIWRDAQEDWSIFMKRRTLVHKMESFSEAEEEQLRRLDDVCAICHHKMKSAKITPCGHFFHGGCLRKWLYVQNCCPLCHVEFDIKKKTMNYKLIEQ